MTPALVLALTLLAAPPAATTDAEPLPPGAPTDPYELSAWCYGALGEYLTVYETVKPDLRDIDKMFGAPVIEDEPYQSDMAAARQELKLIGEAVTAAEKASPRPIAPIGAEAIRQGAGIWSVAETKTHRELARAWLTWALPDRCDVVARQLAARSALLGKALSYNSGASSPPSDDTPALPPSPAGKPAAELAAPTPPPQQNPPPAAVVSAPPTEPPMTPPAEPAVAQAPPTPATPPPSAAQTAPPPATAPSDQSSEPTL
jgi:hypothetical protein